MFSLPFPILVPIHTYFWGGPKTTTQDLGLIVLQCAAHFSSLSAASLKEWAKHVPYKGSDLGFRA